MEIHDMRRDEEKRELKWSPAAHWCDWSPTGICHRIMKVAAAPLVPGAFHMITTAGSA